MEFKPVEPMPTSPRFRAKVKRSFPRKGLISLAALALAAVAAPAPCFAQISLGSGSYAIFENGSGNGSLLSLSGTNSISGNIEVGPNVSLTPTQLSQLNQAASGTVSQNVAAVSTTLPTATPTSLGNITGTSSVTGTSAINEYNVGSINLTGDTFTINGTSTETFIFNVSGAVTLGAGGFLNLSPSAISLSGGVDAKNVIFIVSGGAVSIGGAILGGSSAAGTFVDQSGTISVTGSSSVTGALVSNSTITVSGGSSVTGDPFAAPAVAHAPEMPTLVSAGFACVVILGTAGARRGYRLWMRPRSPSFA